MLARRPLPRGLPPLGRLLRGLLAFQLLDVPAHQMGRMSATAGAVLDGAGVGFEARQIQPLDDTPNLARRILLVDQAFDIERLEPHLVAVENKNGGGWHEIECESYGLYRRSGLGSGDVADRSRLRNLRRLR